MTHPFCIYCNNFVDTLKEDLPPNGWGKPTITIDTGKCVVCMNETVQRDRPQVSNTV